MFCFFSVVSLILDNYYVFLGLVFFRGLQTPRCFISSYVFQRDRWSIEARRQNLDPRLQLQTHRIAGNLKLLCVSAKTKLYPGQPWRLPCVLSLSVACPAFHRPGLVPPHPPAAGVGCPWAPVKPNLAAPQGLRPQLFSWPPSPPHICHPVARCIPLADFSSHNPHLRRDRSRHSDFRRESQSLRTRLDST